MYLNTSVVMELQADMILTLTPVAIVIVMYMILGIFGNILVIIYYGFKLKPNSCFMFIVAMAICDFIVCSVSMPLEIVDILDFNNFPNVIACKILRFVNFAATIASNLFLLSISIDRYKKLCRPFCKQISLKSTRIIIISIFLVVPLLSSPSIVFYDVIDENLTLYDKSGSKGEIISRDCKVQDIYRRYALINQIVLFFGSIINSFIIWILYFRVIKEMVKMKKFRDNSKVKLSVISHTFARSLNQSQTADIDSYLNNSEEEIDKSSTRQKYEKQLPQTRNNTHKRMFTLISLSITVAFIISYLPFTILMIWQLISDYHSQLTGPQLAVYEIFLRSWLISSCVNPIIYGFYNHNFRRFFTSICYT